MMSSKKRFEGKSIIVTGGTGALGQVVTRCFLEEGAHVTVSWIVEEEARHLQDELKEFSKSLTCVRADVTKENDVKVLAQEALFAARNIDCLVNLVGGYAGGLLWKTEEEIWNKMLSINLTSTFQCCRVIGEVMAQDARGRIIMMAARPALEDVPGIAAYSVSKAGVVKLMKVMVKEFEGSDITVNCIAPSIIDTPANRKSSPRADHSKWVKCEEIAGQILDLCCEEGAKTTGQVVQMYGDA
jgi:NAD(P)-dependent dehydrogenase (short-subunit alcohol dehydrogenase family)